MLFADYETYVAAQDRVSALYKVSRKRNLTIKILYEF